MPGDLKEVSVTSGGTRASVWVWEPRGPRQQPLLLKLLRLSGSFLETSEPDDS